MTSADFLRALKTGAPEIIREDYDTQYSESVSRGDHYRTSLEEASAEAEVAAAVGISVDELQPGMALLGTGRRRGWRDGVTVADWARHGNETLV
jgi:actin-related protein 10